jgi:hypothetical protein
MMFLQQFLIWKGLGGGALWEMDVKTAEALLILDREWQVENERGQK